MKKYYQARFVLALLGSAAWFAPTPTQAGLISAVLVGPDNAPYSYNLTIEFANGNYYDFTLRSTQPTISGQTLIDTVDAARPEVVVTQTAYSFGNAVTGITIGSDTASGFVNNSYWAYWNTNTTSPTQWVLGDAGESARMLTPGQDDGWVYSDGSHAPQQATAFPAVPEPGTLAWVGAALAGGVAVCATRRRDGTRPGATT